MFCYIDPGTGSMLFTILLGVFGALIYSIRLFFVKAKTMFGGKKNEALNKKIPFVIYSDDKRYFSVFEPICRELDKLDKEILYLTASEDDPIFTKSFKNIKAECIGKTNKSFFRLNYLNANIVISTTPSLGVFQWTRSKKVDYYVHVLHAAGGVTLYRMFGIDYYDAILLSCNYQVEEVRALEKLRNLPAKEIELVGIPYMDEMAKRLAVAGQIENEVKTVLLAPSWGPSAIFSVYGGAIIDELLKTGYHVIIRPHPQSFESEKELMQELMEKYPESENLEWNRDVDNFEVLRRSDVLISDFSGVIFDFALIYGKPIIYTDPNYDLSPYDAWWLEGPVWKVAIVERMGFKLTQENFGNIRELVDECLQSQEIKENLKTVKDEIWVHQGEGAVRVTNYLSNKLEQLLTKAEEPEKEQNEKKSFIKFWKKRKPKADEAEVKNIDENESMGEDVDKTA